MQIGSCIIKIAQEQIHHKNNTRICEEYHICEYIQHNNAHREKKAEPGVIPPHTCSPNRSVPSSCSLHINYYGHSLRVKPTDKLPNSGSKQLVTLVLLAHFSCTCM